MDLQTPALQRLADRIRAARADRTALDIRGGNTKTFYGGNPQGQALDLAELCGISSYEPSELVITARAGTPLAEVEAAIAARGQCLAFEPPRFAAGGTVGGMVAAGLAGPARASAGSVRDFVLGLTMLDGRGDVLTFGGQVMKNVAGYDVSRLMAGSLGVLGVLCEVSLKVLPVAPAQATLEFALDQKDAIGKLNTWCGLPLPVNASSWHDNLLRLRLRGARAAVESACASLGGRRMDEVEASAWWNGLRDQQLPFFHGDAFDNAEEATLWRVSVPDTTDPLPLPGSQLMEWHGALRWHRTTADAQAIQQLAQQHGGHAEVFRTTAGRMRQPGSLSPAALQLHQRVKAAFDPDGILNPGRLHPEL